jgi:hypothetical protein
MRKNQNLLAATILAAACCDLNIILIGAYWVCKTTEKRQPSSLQGIISK